MSPQLINLLILITAGCVAYTLGQVFNYFMRCVENYPKKRYLRGQLYQKKQEKLLDNAQDYYLTVAINNPVELSYQLAVRDINRLKRQGKVVEMYSKLRLKGVC